MDESINTCTAGLLENDALWISLALAVPIAPMLLGLVLCYVAKHPFLISFRMFCFSFTVYGGFVINVYMIPYMGCPGVPMSQYPSIVKVAIQLGYFIIPAGLTLSGCEFAWYAAKNKIFANLKLCEDVGVNWDQSFGFHTVESYFSSDQKECPLKIEVQHTGKCFGNAHDAMFSSKNADDLGEMPLYVNSTDFQYDRVEDRSDPIPKFSTLKPWQAVQFKFSYEILPGDQLTLNQMTMWKEGHKNSFEKYTADNFEELKKKNDGMPFNHSSFDESIQLKNLQKNVVIHDSCLKPWYVTPICWVIAFCGALCILWIPTAFKVWRVKKLHVTIRKHLFIEKEKYKPQSVPKSNQ